MKRREILMSIYRKRASMERRCGNIDKVKDFNNKFASVFNRGKRA